SVDRSLHTCHVLLLRRILICRRCRTLVQAVGAGVRLPEDPGICPGRRPVEGAHLPLRLPRSLRALAPSPPGLAWAAAPRALAARGSRNLPGTKTRGGVSPALELAQKLTGLGAIAAGDFLVGGHAALARRGLALELVLVVHAFAHDLASASHAHALLGAAVRL